MSEQPTREEVGDLKRRFILAFQAWLRVPGDILAAGAEANVSTRPQMCAFLERKWYKLRQDLNGTLSLVNTNHIGPAAALTRVCRETAVRMLVWSFSDLALDRPHIHMALDVRPKDNASRLIRDATRLLQVGETVFHPTVVRLLHQGIDTAKATLADPDSMPCEDVPPEARRQGFATLTRTAIERMMVSDIDPSILARQLIDYWLECEAIHTGEGAMHLYEPEEYGQEIELNGKITCLARLNDLYSVKPMVMAALINVVQLMGKLEKPKESEELAVIASVAERVVAGFVQPVQDGSSNPD